MIKIGIKVKNGKVFDESEIKDSTLGENALAIRRLEEIKLRLLDVDYKEELLIEEDS
jgi:hypothetical protein